MKHLDVSLVALGAQAELLFTLDPPACLMRLRLLGERLARELAAHAGLSLLPDEKPFRGELVDQNPDDEPADALLDRIRAEVVAKPTKKTKRRRRADASEA